MQSFPRAPLQKIYDRLYKTFGQQHWWPAESPFEVIVGAILTQNTNWTNVEKAIANLRGKGLLDLERLKEISLNELAAHIRPAGYFNIKARRLKNFIDFACVQYKGSLTRMSRRPMMKLREELLEINGIGPETADSILLYAFHKPIFVVDAYTKRMLVRHNWISRDSDYQSIQKLWMQSQGGDAAQYNEYHALLVRLGKEFCRPNPRCEQCPLNAISYSLKHKCRICHRAFTPQEVRQTCLSAPQLMGQDSTCQACARF